mmetsp:Transcript_2613/g.9142  ORF Transcript_2613/g.9142 Transcript_2613/m.9142 type:complete len:255 (-) Transcript_2613:1930-2694(-)
MVIVCSLWCLPVGLMSPYYETISRPVLFVNRRARLVRYGSGATRLSFPVPVLVFGGACLGPLGVGGPSFTSPSSPRPVPATDPALDPLSDPPGDDPALDMKLPIRDMRTAATAAVAAAASRVPAELAVPCTTLAKSQYVAGRVLCRARRMLSSSSAFTLSFRGVTKSEISVPVAFSKSESTGECANENVFGQCPVSSHNPTAAAASFSISPSPSPNPNPSGVLRVRRCLGGVPKGFVFSGVIPDPPRSNAASMC